MNKTEALELKKRVRYLIFYSNPFLKLSQYLIF